MKIVLVLLIVCAASSTKAFAQSKTGEIRWGDVLTSTLTSESRIFEARNLLMQTPFDEFMPTGDFYVLSQMKWDWDKEGRYIWWPTIQFGITGHSPVLTVADIEDDGVLEVLLEYKA